MFGRRPTSIASSRSRARSLTADAAKAAGADAIPDPIPGHEATPRRGKHGEEVAEVEGTCIKYVVTMPINGSRRAGGAAL